MERFDELISVIVPVYNVEKYLERCINSIISQSYENIEVLVVNDGSTDKSLEVIKELARVDNRIKIFSQKNGGLSAARNTGIDNAAGKYIMFVDSDDYIHPQMIEILYNNLIITNADISVCDLHWINEGESVEEYIENNIEVYEGKSVLRKLIGDNMLSVVAWNKLYKKILFDDLRYPVGRLHEDEFIIHYILRKCEKSVYTDAKLYYYVKREGSIVAVKSTKNLKDALDAFCERLIWALSIKDKIFIDACFDAMLGMANSILNKTDMDNFEELQSYTQNQVKKTISIVGFSLYITWRKLLIGKVWEWNPNFANKFRKYLRC